MYKIHGRRISEINQLAIFLHAEIDMAELKMSKSLGIGVRNPVGSADSSHARTLFKAAGTVADITTSATEHFGHPQQPRNSGVSIHSQSRSSLSHLSDTKRQSSKTCSIQ